MRTARAAFTASLLLLAAGCAGSPRPATSPAPEPSDRAIDVQVDNQNFYDMNVYLVAGGTRWLVGRVGGLTRGTLTIPASLAPADQRVRLLAVAIGGQRPIITPTLVVPPGEQVYWTIGSDPSMSTVSAG
jgi:hypothetical protein